MTKIACLAICKNEQDNVVEFVKNVTSFGIVKVFILDTGSTDQSVDFFKKFSNVVVQEKIFQPFSFSEARNHLRDLVPEEFDYYLHLDLDERIQSLPSLDLDKKCCVMGTRIESLYNTVTENYLRLTPSLEYEYHFPVHEILVPAKPDFYWDEKFVIEHQQKLEKDRYESMTETYFTKWPEHLFYHFIEDLYRLKEYDRLLNVFSQYKDSNAFKILSDQQKWYVVRNYQLSLLQTYKSPDMAYLAIFETFKSASSCYYLSLFYFHLGNTEKAQTYYNEGLQVVDSALNKKFFNKKIKGYLEQTFLNSLQNLT